MKWPGKKSMRKWLRIIHRDLGFFLVGITLVYAISGIILNHKKQGVDPAYKTIYVSKDWEKTLTVQQVKTEFRTTFNEYQLNKLVPDDNGYQLYLNGGVGFYSPETGKLWFEIYKKKPLVFFFNKLHYNQKKFWTTPADFYAGGLIFLALSGLFMVRGRKGMSGRGIWYALAGILLVLGYIWL